MHAAWSIGHKRTCRGTDAGEKGGTTPVRGGVLRFLHGRYGAQSTTPSRDGACNVMHPFIYEFPQCAIRTRRAVYELSAPSFARSLVTNSVALYSAVLP